jgi:hypothetical protein
MLEEIALDDAIALEPVLCPVSSERLSGPMIITNVDWNQQQSTANSVVERGKSAFSEQQSYIKLIEDEFESVDTVTQQVSLFTFPKKHSDS